MTETTTGAWDEARCDGTPEDARNRRRFAVWCLAWAAAFVAATLLLDGGVVPPGAATWVVAVAPSLIGLAAIRSYVTFVRGADELVRRIQLESLAWGFGAGVLFQMGYRLLERAGAPTLDLNDGLLVMVVVWAAAQLAITRRYR